MAKYRFNGGGGGRARLRGISSQARDNQEKMLGSVGAGTKWDPTKSTLSDENGYADWGYDSPDGTYDADGQKEFEDLAVGPEKTPVSINSVAQQTRSVRTGAANPGVKNTREIIHMTPQQKEKYGRPLTSNPIRVDTEGKVTDDSHPMIAPVDYGGQGGDGTQAGSVDFPEFEYKPNEDLVKWGEDLQDRTDSFRNMSAAEWGKQYGMKILSPEEIDRRERSSNAIRGIQHLGNMMAAFGNLYHTRGGAPSQTLPDVKRADSGVDTWQNRQQQVLNSYLANRRNEENAISREKVSYLKAVEDDKKNQVAVYSALQKEYRLAADAKQKADKAVKDLEYKQKQINSIVLKDKNDAEKLELLKQKTEVENELKKALAAKAEAEAQLKQIQGEVSIQKGNAYVENVHNKMVNRTSSTANQNTNRNARTEIARQSAANNKPKKGKDKTGSGKGGWTFFSKK